MEGYIKLNRKMLNWRWYKNSVTKDVFIHLLLTANYKDTDFENITVKRGQVMTGRKALAEALGLTEQNIRTALNHLKQTGEITVESNNKFSIITVCKYEEYQEFYQPATNQQLTNDQPATNQQPTSNQPHKKKDNKENKEKNVKNHLHEAAAVKNLFEEICISFPKPVTETIAEVMPDKELDYQTLFTKAESSDFLTGRSGKATMRFTADWIITNADRILSGKYDNPKEKERTSSYDIYELERIL